MSAFRRIRAVFLLVSLSMVATAVLLLSPLPSVMDIPFQTRPVLADELKETSGAAVVDVATYEGVINPVAAEYMAQAIADAAKDHAEALVIRMDTPGGLDTSMRMIIKEMSASEAPIIVYVSPVGARAASAGVFITLAAHIAAMSPGTNIGAAHPVSMGGGEMDKEMKKKVENDAAAYIKSIADKHGRNVQWAEDAVRQSVSATETEALKLKIIDLIAPDLPALLTAVDGRTVETASGRHTLQTKSAVVKKVGMSGRLEILNALSDPNIAYILMLLGIYGLIFELSNPGAILPGVVGAICIVLAFYSFQTLSINYAGLLLILLAVVMFIAEIKVPSYGLLTVGGVVSMVLGSLMLVKTDMPSMQISLWVILPTAVVTAGFFVGVVGMAWKSRHQKSVAGIEGFIGVEGTARTEINPRGQIRIQGEIWEAVSSEPIREGEAVEVTGVEGLKLHIKRSRLPDLPDRQAGGRAQK
ncbi:MAG: nodulation protein NfeD [Nitrospirae bacterium]|nr:nodulation protein NfeD [Nitrospirota bacterium]